MSCRRWRARPPERNQVPRRLGPELKHGADCGVYSFPFYWVNDAATSAVHFGLACLVTVHALLRKREVPTAIGWIGVAWLAPGVGAILYFGFGINRVKRRARRL